jgi:bifunctional ADP-heptose synthase (sugar kinase/adenylyltransferase)
MVSLTKFARNGDTYRCRGNKEGEMANVITYGTYDLFHIGHLKLLQRARALGGENDTLTNLALCSKLVI